jgi:class 3 adenylate cyclase/CHASE2 domain-containing sensor protein
MTRNERKLLIRTIELGMLLTIFVIALDGAGGLDWLERLLYDYRARDCQFCTPPPTDRLVHIDIDDPSLDEIGAFPWPRTKLAEMIDEITLAGAKHVAMDILFAEPQATRWQPVGSDPKGPFEAVKDDDNFAAAIKRAGNVMLPVSLDFESSQRPPIFGAVYTLLLKDLELEPSDMVSQLRGSHFDNPRLAQQIGEVFFAAREAAMVTRISDEMAKNDTDVQHLSDALLPRAAAARARAGLRAEQQSVLEKLLPRVQSVRIIMERTAPLPDGLPNLLSAYDEHAVTIPILTEAAAYSAYPDFLPDHDGVVRRVPLMVNYRGRLFPHQALVIACAQLGVDLQQIRCLPNEIILPLPDGHEIHIPVETIHSDRYGKVGMFMNIPFFGGKEWETMYDWANHAEPVQHVPLKNIWAICEMKHDIAKNETEADDALLGVEEAFPSDKATAFLKKSPAERTSTERWAAIGEALETMESLMDPSLLQAKMEDLKPDDQKFVAAYRVLKNVKSINDGRVQEIRDARNSLKYKLSGRSAIIGWTATGKVDFYSTSLHAKCPGMVILGVVFNGIVNRELWRVMPWWLTVVITLIIGAVTTYCVARLEPKLAMICTLVLMLIYFAVNGLLLFDWSNMIVGAAAPLTTAALVWSTLTLVRFISETTQRRKIMRRFQTYVDPQIVDYSMEHLDDPSVFGGQVRLMTVVFTDLAGFTTISERLRERTVPLLNAYMSLMLPVIRENRGIWNKFLGDGIMFFFGAPQETPTHAQDAVRTVLQMQHTLIKFNEDLKEKALPAVAMRAGISTGPMIVGDAGSNDEKHGASDYTVLGDEVNLGARLESANKYLGTKLLMNEFAAQLCGDQFLLRPVGNICVVGKSEGVLCYEPLCPTSDATDTLKRYSKLSQDVVDNFCLSHFDPCLKAAETLEAEFGATKFTTLYQSLARLYISEPPGEKFDGQIVLAEK